MVRIVRTTSADPDFAPLVKLLDQELWARYDQEQTLYDHHNRIEANNTVIIAYVQHEPAGCACMKQFNDTTIEIKRMFVKPEHRGKGIAYTLLAELEGWATALSFKQAILETGLKQPEALHLYKKFGYTIIENYGPYTGMAGSVCMSKQLAGHH